jgi:adenylate cyclase
LDEARAAIESLAAVPTDPGFVLYELPLLRLRALLARAHDDDGDYRTFARRYLAMAHALEFKGHLATARTME